MSARVLRRPIGGWGARQWRREVFQALSVAVFVLASWWFCQCVLAVMGALAEQV